MDNTQKQDNEAAEAEEEFREKLAKMTTKQLERKLEITQAKIERAKRSYNKTAAQIKAAGQKERTHKLIIAGATLIKFFPRLIERDDDAIAKGVSQIAALAKKAHEMRKSAGSKSPR